MQVNFSIQPPEFDTRFTHPTEAATNKNDSEIKIKPPVENKSSEETQSETGDIKVLENVLAEHNISLKFGRDEETEQIVVEMIDSKTGDVVRQIPSEVSIALGKVFEKIQGRFIDERI
ncbi:MAG: flagellar protein FlaG [Pyrinomonadaceae bacterium]